MNRKDFHKLFVILICTAFVFAQVLNFAIVPQNASADSSDYNSPFSVEYSPDGSMLAVSDSTKGQLQIIDTSSGSISDTIQLNGEPKGVAWSGTLVYVAEYGAGTVAEIDSSSGSVVRRFSTGPMPMGVAVVPGKSKLVVTEFGLGQVNVVDLSTGDVIGNVDVNNYPYFVDITTDGNYAIVGHMLPDGDATQPGFASSVTFVDINTFSVTSNVSLPSGATSVKGIKCSPDGNWAYVVHTLGKTNLPTTHITKGWVNTNALSIIDVSQQDMYTTVLLDRMMEGAANPWGLTISSDSNTLWVSIAGVHQVLKLDLYTLHDLIAGNVPTGESPTAYYRFVNRLSGYVLDVPGSSQDDGVQLIQWSYNGGDNQKWDIQDIGNGYVNIVNKSSGKAVDNYGSLSDGAPIVQHTLSSTNQDQQWEMIDLGGGYYKFINRTSGKALCNNGSTSENAGIVQNTDDGSQGQQWKVELVEGSESYTNLLYRSKAAYDKPYSDIWFQIKDDPANTDLLKYNLGALWGADIIEKIELPGQGPRGISISPDGTEVAVGAYFAGEIYTVDTATNEITSTISMGVQPAEDMVRRGERIFHDATLSQQGWLTCATCHPDARPDGFNWDLPGDGIGNPLNTRSVLASVDTLPLLWHGGVPDMQTEISGGFRHLLFTQQPQQVFDDVEAYLASLTPQVSPYRNPDGSLTADAEAGKIIFESAQTECATCHSGQYYTDLQTYNVGTANSFDNSGSFDTPQLIELWRTAPYLHDGSAATIRDVLTTCNPGDQHGVTSHLTSTEIDQLEAYLLQMGADTAVADTEPPTAPANLRNTDKTDTTVSLAWDASTDNIGVTGYNIYKDSVLEDSTTGTSYTVTGLTADTSYTFTVTAKDAAGNESDPSNAVTVTTDGILPSGWDNDDIGDVGAVGGATYSNGTFTITGSGADIWGTADEFHYVYKQVTGDCEISARVATIENTDAWAKAGVMMRETLNADSKFTQMVMTPSSGAAFQWRSTTGGTCENTTNTEAALPQYVKLVRTGDSFTAFYSSDGTNWTQLGTAITVSMTDSIYIGLPVTSHNDGTLCTATIDNVNTVVMDTEPPTAPTNLRSTDKTDTTVSLAWDTSTDNVGVTEYDVYKDSVYESSTTDTTYTVTGLNPGTTYAFTVKARDAAGNESAPSNEITVTTESTNIALAKPASADSEESGKGNTADKGNDGSLSTRWCANDGELNHWWKVDLETSYNLTGSEVTWEFDGKVYDYMIEVSDDNVNWTTVVDKTSNTSTSQVQSDSFTATGRYVRITVTGLESGCWASFFELEVYGY